MNTKNLLTKVEKFLGVECTHKSVNNYSCKFCPDCGKKVVIKLVSIKCMECGHLRTAVNSGYNHIVPQKEFCCFCGSSEWSYQYYFDSTIPDKLREISVSQVMEDKENPFRFENTDNFTNVWVEKPQREQRIYKSNVIKPKRT